MSVLKDADWSGIFNETTGMGETGSLNPKVGSAYDLSAILDTDVELLDEERNVISRTNTISVLNSSLSADLKQGDVWTLTSTSRTYKITELMSNDGISSIYACV